MEITGYKTDLDVEYAGFWLRAAALIVDAIVLWIPCSVFGWVFAGLEQSAGFEALDIFQSIVICTLYSGFMESSQYQASIGKIALGLKVTDIEGQRLSFSRASARYLASMLSAIICAVGFFMAGWTQKKQALHDMITDCLVIKAGR